MSFSFRRFFKGIRIVPKAVSSTTALGDIDVDSANNKINFNNGTTASPIITESHNATISNKKLDDSSVTFADTGDPTSQLGFDVLGAPNKKMTIATAHTDNRTLFLPNTNDTLVAKNTTDTLNNKSFFDSTTEFIDSVDPTIKVKIDAAGTTGKTTTITSSQTVDRTITLPDATDTLIGKNTNDILTNKTISGATNTITNIPVSSALTGAVPVANGGTNSTTALNNNRVMQSSSGSIVESAAITANRALISDSNGLPTHSSVTNTELGYVSGVTSSIQTQINSIASLAFPSGVILPYAGTSTPDASWLLCYGQTLDAVANPQYLALYNVIGTTYGGTGSSSFNVPDLRGRAVAGKDNMGGSAANRITAAGSGITGTTLGAAGGAETHTLSTSQMPSHTHVQNAHNHTQNAHSHTIPAGGLGGSAYTGSNTSPNTTTTSSTTATNNQATATNQNEGGGLAHQNTQPSIILNYIIKL